MTHHWGCDRYKLKMFQALVTRTGLLAPPRRMSASRSSQWNPKVVMRCALSALVSPAAVWRNGQCDGSRDPHSNRGFSVKKAALALALVVASLSLGGCFVGKGKAPAPIVTKG